MEHTIKKLDESRIELTVDLDTADLSTAVATAERELAHEARMDGFRPGKVPTDVLRKNINEQKLREEALDVAVRSSLAKIIEQEKLDILDQGDLSVKTNTPEKFIYTLTITLFPSITLGAYKELAVTRRAIVTKDEEIRKVLDNLRAMHASVRQVQRAAQPGDLVEVDYAITVEGKTLEGGTSENHPLIIGEHTFIPGFEDALVGMTANELKEITLNVPGDYYQKTIAGKTIVARVTMKQVQERTMPELTNDFARTLGQFTSIQNLETSIKEGITMEKEAKERDRIRIELLQKIADVSTVTVPALLIKRQLDSMVEGFDAELHEKGMEMALYLAHVKKTQDELRADWKPQAEKQVKLLLVANAVAKAEHLTIDGKDVEKEFEAQVQRYILAHPEASQEVLEKIDADHMKRSIFASLLHEKVFTFLEKHATIATA